MNRRSLLKYTAYLTGYAAVAPLSSTILSGCAADATATTGFTPAFFTAKEYAHVVAMINTMLPPTATPGAVELGVPEFVDQVLAIYTEADDQEEIRAGLGSWSTAIKQQAGKLYHELPAEEQLSLLNELDVKYRKIADETEAKDQVYISEHKPNNVDKEEPTTWWLTLKSIAIGGYYSSEKIGTEVLAYDPVPGPYQGCIPLEDVGKSWSL
ncbi:MAG: gluconate 2-dehydrogenase subunit 3 family protein [Bacteroidota bacterium]